MTLLQRRQTLTHDLTGQSLYWDAPEGRPSSVTSVTVYMMGTGDDGTTEDATTGSASVESDPDTTFDADSGSGQANARDLNLAATTGIEIGRYYLATDAEGRKEWPEIVAVDSGNTATSRHPLQNSYANGDPFQSTRISISVKDAWIQDETNLSDGIDPTPGFRIRWVYVVDSVTYTHDDYFDVVRYPAGHTVTPSDVDAMFPGYVYRLPTNHKQDEGRRLLDEAYQQVSWDLRASELDPASIRDEDAMNRAVMLKFGVMLSESGADEEEVDRRESRYNSFFDRIFRVATKVKTSRDTSGAGQDTPRLPLFTK